MEMTTPPDKDGESQIKPPAIDGRTLDDLTLAEVVGRLLRAPRQTCRALIANIESPVEDESPAKTQHPTEKTKSTSTAESNPAFALVGFSVLYVIAVTIGALLFFMAWGRPLVMGFYLSVAVSVGMVAQVGIKSTLGATGKIAEQLRYRLSDSIRDRLQLGLWAAAFVLCLNGCYIMLGDGGRRSEATQLADGLPYLLAGFAVWLYAEISKRTGEKHPQQNAEETPRWAFSADKLLGIHPARTFAALALPILLFIVWTQTTNNQFRAFGFWMWLLSIVAVLVIVAPVSWSPPNVWRALGKWNARRIRHQQASIGKFRLSWVWAAFIVIMIVGVAFRLNDFNSVPPQMTSDHKEKLLDAQRIVDGRRDIFFMNNGGREGFQMYAMAAFAQLPGLGMNHRSLVLLAVIESIITLPTMFWLGKQIVGKEQRELGVALGLIMMGLLAASYWHLSISRQGLRIVLTPLVGAILLGFLARAMRHNRRGDFIAAGLTLGFGLYMYQAVRMMPVLVLAAVGIAILWSIRDPRKVMRYAVHLAALILVAFVIFVPLFRFSLDYPDSFWMRSAGRLFGDNTIQEVQTGGEIIQRSPTVDERLGAFIDNLPQLGNNIRNALLMFHWRGDQAWINGVPFQPQLDPVVGALFMVGLAACIGFAIRTRDPVYALLPVAVFIMLLPSALSIAMTNENPSATRASGAIPAVFTLAALPFAVLVITLKRMWNPRIAFGMVGSLAGIAIYLSLAFNWPLYYTQFRDIYRFTTWPYSIPGEILRGFHMSDGDYANAYMIGYTLWWDYTIIGIEAGAMDWPNGIVGIENLPRYMNDQRYCPNQNYPLRTDRDFLVFYHHDDDETDSQLYDWFPNGYSKRIITYNSPTYDFMIFRVPAMGDDGFRQFALAHAINPRCNPPSDGIDG